MSKVRVKGWAVSLVSGFALCLSLGGCPAGTGQPASTPGVLNEPSGSDMICVLDVVDTAVSVYNKTQKKDMDKLQKAVAVAAGGLSLVDGEDPNCARIIQSIRNRGAASPVLPAAVPAK